MATTCPSAQACSALKKEESTLNSLSQLELHPKSQQSASNQIRPCLDHSMPHQLTCSKLKLRKKNQRSSSSFIQMAKAHAQSAATTCLDFFVIEYLWQQCKYRQQVPVPSASMAKMSYGWPAARSMPNSSSDMPEELCTKGTESAFSSRPSTNKCNIDQNESSLVHSPSMSHQSDLPQLYSQTCLNSK